MQFGDLISGDKFIYPIEDPRGGRADVLIKLPRVITVTESDGTVYKTNAIVEKTGDLSLHSIPDDSFIICLDMSRLPKKLR